MEKSISNRKTNSESKMSHLQFAKKYQISERESEIDKSEMDIYTEDQIHEDIKNTKNVLDKIINRNKKFDISTDSLQNLKSDLFSFSKKKETEKRNKKANTLKNKASSPVFLKKSLADSTHDELTKQKDMNFGIRDDFIKEIEIPENYDPNVNTISSGLATKTDEGREKNPRSESLKDLTEKYNQFMFTKTGMNHDQFSKPRDSGRNNTLSSEMSRNLEKLDEINLKAKIPINDDNILEDFHKKFRLGDEDRETSVEKFQLENVINSTLSKINSDKCFIMNQSNSENNIEKSIVQKNIGDAKHNLLSTINSLKNLNSGSSNHNLNETANKIINLSSTSFKKRFTESANQNFLNTDSKTSDSRRSQQVFHSDVFNPNNKKKLDQIDIFGKVKYYKTVQVDEKKYKHSTLKQKVYNNLSNENSGIKQSLQKTEFDKEMVESKTNNALKTYFGYNSFRSLRSNNEETRNESSSLIEGFLVSTKKWAEKEISNTNFNKKFRPSSSFSRLNNRNTLDNRLNRLSLSKSRERVKKVMDKRNNPAMSLLEGEDKIYHMVQQVHGMHDLNSRFFKNKKFRFSEKGEVVNEGQVESVYIHGGDLFKC